MPGVIDPETMNKEGLPGLWSAVQWVLTEEECVKELDTRSTASCLSSVDVPEVILRLLLHDMAIHRLLGPPEGFDSIVQEDWDPELVTIAFLYPIELVKAEREPNYLYFEYKGGDSDYGSIEIEPVKARTQRK
jgi:hypothetical protein